MKNSNGKPTNQVGSKRPSDTFLEAFRDLGSDTASTIKNDLFKKGAQDIFGSISPFGQNQTPLEPENRPHDPFRREAELEKSYRSKVSKLENIHREERVLFTREQRETQNQVAGLQEEIKKLAKATAELSTEAKEAEMTAMQEAPIVGTYHLNFFVRLRQAIAELRAQIQESSYWLASWNKKAGKKNNYWNQFKKSGASFSLHHDRAVATQAG